jgi:steroid delta-isomerase
MSDNKIYIAAVNTYLRALSEKDLDAIVGLYAENATVEDPVGSEVVQGIEAIKAFYSKATSMDIKVELSGQIRVAGKEAAFPFSLQIPGQVPMQIQVIDLFRFNDAGKIISMRAFWGPDNCTPA